MKLEACIETLAEAKLAAAHNLNRVELCVALDLGGLTPTAALISACAEVIEVHAMIRPRGGDFVYTAEEENLMLAEMQNAKKAGATGVVFGCLLPSGEIDFALTQRLVLEAKKAGLQTTLHRAFDFVTDQQKALEELMDLGIDRVLTSGGKPSAIAGLEEIARLVKTANGRIEIMAGSGVNATNAEALKATNIDALHFSIRKPTGSVLPLAMGVNYAPDVEKIQAIINEIKSTKIK
jgi:copper homeostasis protein